MLSVGADISVNGIQHYVTAVIQVDNCTAWYYAMLNSMSVMT